MRKTSTAERKQIRVWQYWKGVSVLLNKLLGQHCKQGSLFRAGIGRRDTELFTLLAKEAAPQRIIRILKSKNQFFRKINNSLDSVDLLLSASLHFLFHTGSGVSLVKNNASLVIWRHICGKSGQYCYLYTTSLHSEVMLCTFRMFLMIYKTHIWSRVAGRPHRSHQE